MKKILVIIFFILFSTTCYASLLQWYLYRMDHTVAAGGGGPSGDGFISAAGSYFISSAGNYFTSN